jgi:hypothetical protein
MRVIGSCLLIAAIGGGLGACMSSASSGAAATPAPARPSATRDSSALVPVGFGTLRQDDIALRLQRFSVQVRLIPLDESIIRLLSPDSYRSLQSLRESRRAEIDATARRLASAPSIWYATFFSTDPGEARFSPMELTITNVGRDFRPIEMFALTPGFGEQRLKQRESQSALVLFEPQLDPNQPLVVNYQSTTNGDWSATLETLERERALVRTRAASARKD